MYVSGSSSATRWPSIRTSAIRPLNLPRHEPSCRRASSSTTMKPTLCRFPAYSRPGLPRPTTSRSSDEARSPRLQGRRTASYSSASDSPPPLVLGSRLGVCGLGLGALGCSSAPSSPSSATSSRASWTLAMTVSSGSSSSVTPSGTSTSREPERVADPEPGDVGLEVLRDLERQRLDVDLVRDLREDAALADADRVADERDRRPRSGSAGRAGPPAGRRA